MASACFAYQPATAYKCDAVLVQYIVLTAVPTSLIDALIPLSRLLLPPAECRRAGPLHCLALPCRPPPLLRCIMHVCTPMHVVRNISHAYGVGEAEASSRN